MIIQNQNETKKAAEKSILLSNALKKKKTQGNLR